MGCGCGRKAKTKPTSRPTFKLTAEQRAKLKSQRVNARLSVVKQAQGARNNFCMSCEFMSKDESGVPCCSKLNQKISAIVLNGKLVCPVKKFNQY